MTDEIRNILSNRCCTLATSHCTIAKGINLPVLRSKLSKKYIHSVYNNHTYKYFDNVLNREFNVSSPSEVWVSDITYIHTINGFSVEFMYLCTF
jgi:transposase InsO family protein